MNKMGEIKKEEVSETFLLMREYLQGLSEDVENEYVNKSEYIRQIRLHKRLQNRKDIDGMISKLNNIEAKIIFMINDAPKWLKRK